MEKRLNFIIRFRWIIILLFIAVPLFLGSQIKKARMNSDMLTYLPEEMPARVNRAKVEELFGGTDMVMLIVKTRDVLNPETLERVRKLAHGMNRIKGIDKVMSVFDLKQIRGEDGALIVNPAVKKIPQTIDEINEIKKELSENDMVYGNVISKDFSTTAIMGLVEPGTSDKAVVGEVEKLIEKFPGSEEVLIGGTPYTRVQTGDNSKKDLARLLPLGLIIMLVFLFACFRQFRGVWMPFAVVLMSIFTSMGMIPLLGWDFTVITIILPVLLIAVANDYGIHMFARYQEDNVYGNTLTKKELAGNMLKSLGRPILFTGVTTMAGLLCLKGHILVPAGQMGILAAVGIAFALLASLVFIPAVSSLLPKIKPIHDNESKKDKSSVTEKILESLALLVTKKPKAIILSTIVFTLGISTGIFYLTVNTNPANYYKEGHPVRYTAEMINEKLGGFFPLSVVCSGDIKDPGVLKKMDEIEKRIGQIPEVGSTTSIARVMRQISRVVYNSDEEGYDKIPDSYNASSQFFELYLMSGDPDDFEKMVDFSFENAMVMIRFNTSDTPVLRKAIKQIKEIIKDEPYVTLVGGSSDIFSQLDISVVRGQFISLSIAFVLILLVLALVFRSLKGALAAILPLISSMLALFGIMGIFNIELNVTTALLSTIMLGVGIDYTIHFLWRYKAEIKRGLTYGEAIKEALNTTGRGIVFNAFSVIIGFSALLFSNFIPVKFFGLLIVITIFTCLAGALLLIPSICLLYKPKFIES